MPEPQRPATADDLHGDNPLLSRAEFDHYRGQLAELRRVRERDLPQLLRDARGFVANDAAEEIAQIREDQTVVDARIDSLEAMLQDARVLDDDGWDADRAVPGRVLNVRYVRSGREVAFVLGSAAPSHARAVSVRSPMGQALLGRNTGDVVSVELPDGTVEEISIVSVQPPLLEVEAA